MMTNNQQALGGVLENWLKDLRSNAPTSWAATELSSRASWQAVRVVVNGLTTVEARPDLFAKDGTSLHDAVLIDLSGLGQVAEAFASGLQVQVESLAADFAAFCTAPAPLSQVWILLDIDLPSGTHIPLGEYTVRTVGTQRLAELSPLPSMRRFIRPPDLDPELLGRSAFLYTVQPDVRLTRGLPWLPDLDKRPERKHVNPLLTLQLWNPDEGASAEAYFRVEPGRYTQKRSGSVYIEPRFDASGEEVGEYHRTDGYRVLAREADAFAAFCTSVHGMIEAVRSRTTNSGKMAATAAALGGAANRIIRASQRTMGGTYVDETEADDVVLDYVVALEALLAPDRGDLKRRTSQRGAALWPDDEDRLAVFRILKNAYTRRSNYAHGNDQAPIGAQDLLRIRRTAFAVLLRWMVITSAYGEKALELLDDSLLSAKKRDQVALELQAFFLVSPPAPTGSPDPRHW